MRRLTGDPTFEDSLVLMLGNRYRRRMYGLRTLGFALCLGLTSGCSGDDDNASDGGTETGGETEGSSSTAGPDTEGESDSSESDTDGEPAMDPGRVTLRRLNNVEYNNTVQDLLGTEKTPGDNLPADEVSLGFDNISDVLTMSPLHAELYELAAEELIDEAMRIPMVEPQLWHFEAESMDVDQSVGGASGDYWNIYSNGTVSTTVSLDYAGNYKFRAYAIGQQAGPDFPHMTLEIDGLPVGEFDVEAVQGSPELYEVEFETTAGPHLVAVGFTNDFYDPDLELDRNLLVDYFEVEGPLGLEGATNPLRERIMICDPQTDGEDTCGRQILETFGLRALRRPLTDSEVDRLMALVAQAQQSGDSFDTGLKLALRALLVSPYFLFRVEIDPDPMSLEPHFVNDFEYASRLSYFLWSSMPDDELLAAAAAGDLQDPQKRDQQIVRMLADPRAQALVSNFAGQWLMIRAINDAFKDPAVFPEFTPEMRASMITEMQLFADSILLGDRSMMELLTARTTYVNDLLAEHYGLPPVGPNFVEVDTSAVARQGVLTQAGILSVLSHATHNSPVKRGKWIMENLLCQAPPPPPDDLDIPPLDPIEGGGSLREQLEQHRADPLCASCHVYMDPLGFGLEHYDAVGAWRDDDNGYEIDASGELMSGATFDGALEMADAISEDTGTTRCMVKKTYIYALGRGTKVSDNPYLDELTNVFEAADLRFEDLVLALATSDPFRMRRGEAN